MGGAANLTANRLSAGAETLEVTAQQDRLDEAQHAVAAIENEFNLLRDFIKTILQERS